jgi:hypothetical protein
LKESAPVKLAIDQVKKEGDQLKVNCHLEGDWKNSNLLAAVVQKHAETNVKAGENSGATLLHTNVVRAFTEQPAKEEMSFEINVPAALANVAWQLVLYTQQKRDLKITAAAVYNPS